MITLTIFSYFLQNNIMGKILMTWYTCISVFSIVAVKTGLIPSSNVTLFPYLFLIMTYTIVFSPFFSKSQGFDVERLYFHINKKYIMFAAIYIVTAAIAIHYYVPLILQLAQSGTWYENRNALYLGTFTYSYTWYEYYALIFSGYLRLLALIVGFAIIRFGRRTLIGMLTIITAFVSGILNAMYTSSRGAIINIVLITVVLYLFFYRNIEKNKRRFITILMLLGCVAIIPYLIDVTVARFSSGGSLDSLINYLGHAPVVFNSGVSPITKHMYGEFAFGNLFGDKEFYPSIIGGTWGTGFYTFVGWLFIDWGWIGTIVVAVIVTLILNHIIRKEKYSISNVYIIFFVYYTLLQGVFVIGRDYCYNIVTSLIIYFVVKIIFDKYTFVIGRIRL